MERVIDAQVAENLKCRVLAEGANGPTTPDADLVLEKRQDEVFLIPDILCNSGGVVVSYFEWVQDLQQLFWEEEEVMRREYTILDRAFEAMVQRAPRPTTFRIARRRWRSASKRSGPPRRHADCFRDHPASITSSFWPAISRRRRAPTKRCSRASHPGEAQRRRRRRLFTLDNMTLELMAPTARAL